MPLASMVISQAGHQDGQIITPNENDVLCGRGGSINSHKVSEFFTNAGWWRERSTHIHDTSLIADQTQ
jgi:hypothetical protein